MNPIFNTLTHATLANIEDQLANNEVSVDEELWDFFVDDLGLTAEQADAAVALRPQYQREIFISGQSPLFQENTVSFDPKGKRLLSSGRLTYDQVINVYKTLLQHCAGQLLKLGCDWAAGINDAGQLYCTNFDINKPGAVFEVFDFDPGAFVDGHWQGETPEQTQAAIENPVYLK